MTQLAYVTCNKQSVDTDRQTGQDRWTDRQFLVYNMNNIQVSLDNAIVEYNDSLGHGDISQAREFCDLTQSFSTISLPNYFQAKSKCV